MTEPLDGNVIAAELSRHFGAEVTDRRGVCTHCGASSVVAELVVYCSGPGTVARCPRCGGVSIVLVEIHGRLQVDTNGFALSGR